MKPICVKCHRFYRPKKTGLYFIEGMPDDGAKPGLAEPEKWKPYKLWSGDMWACPDCGAEIISGVGRDRIAEHYEPEFSATAQRLHADFQVNDC